MKFRLRHSLLLLKRWVIANLLPVQMIWVRAGYGVLSGLILISCTVDNSRQPHVNTVSTNTSTHEFTRNVITPSGSSKNRKDFVAEDRRVPESLHLQNRQPHVQTHHHTHVRLKVEEMLVARDVKNRRAIGTSDAFPSRIGSLWSLASVKANGSSAQLEMRWWHGNDLVSTNPFVVSEGIRWSEWSQITVRPKDVGDWRVEVFHPKENKVLKTTHFKIEPPQNQKLAVSLRPLENPEIGKMQTVQSPVLQDSNARPPRINKLKIARSIKRRRPMGVGTIFRVNDERLWGYIEVSNLESPVHVWMEWLRKGEVRSKLRIRVGVSRRWRTWSWQRLSQNDIGDWEVRVLSSQGDILARTYFTVER